jgi:hypothetical protein
VTNSVRVEVCWGAVVPAPLMVDVTTCVSVNVDTDDIVCVIVERICSVVTNSVCVEVC